jgi:hypothetical protein
MVRADCPISDTSVRGQFPTTALNIGRKFDANQTPVLRRLNADADQRRGS